jgi:ABC-type dipeptide/oligopeptide/nickel transport system permease subunit
LAEPLTVAAAPNRRLGTVARTLKQEPVGAIAAVLVLLLVVVAVFAEVIAPQDPTGQALRYALKPPGSPGPNGTTFILGSDSLGRDVFSRLVYGTRISLAIGVAAVLIGTLGGLFVGLFSGYRGGRADVVIQRVMDSIQAIPTIVLAMLLVASLGPAGRNLVVTAVAIGTTQIPRANRVIRSNVLSVAREDYVQAAKAVGASELRILFRHILPNVLLTAKKLLAEAGITPRSLNITMKTSSQYAEDAEVVQQHLAAIGINAQVVVQGRVFSAIVQGQDFDDLAWGVIGGQPLLNYWVGDFIRTGASLNVVKFSDAQVDQLVDAQAREQDPAKRKQITDQLQDRLYEVLPFVATVSRTYFHFTGCRIKNSPLTKPNHNHVSMKLAWIDPTAC